MSAALRAVAHAYRSTLVAEIAFGVTIALGVVGGALAVFGNTMAAVALGGIAFITACLSALAFQAARRWRALADDLERQVHR